jgi:hypothetical protein
MKKLEDFVLPREKIYQIMGKCVSILRKLLLKIKGDIIKGS